MDNRKIIGQTGEDRASAFLEKNGYTIIKRNWRTRTGEIDIIVSKGEFIVFVEVKSLPNGSFELLKKVLNQQKLQRIVKTSKCFLLKHRQYSNSYVRYDVIVIDMPGFNPVYHIENAFTELL